MSHSKFFSPSSISRRIACHGSAFLEQDAPDTSGDAAKYGTFGHAIAEQCLLDRTKHPYEWIGKEMLGQTCDHQLIECVEQYLEDVKEVDSLFNGHLLHGIEAKVNMAGYGMPEIFGTADLVMDEMYGTLVVMDLKTGSGVNVIPDHNSQLMTYALCAARDKETLLSYDNIMLVISQPRAKTGGSSLKIWNIKPADLWSWFNDTLEPCFRAIIDGDKETATYSPSEEACMWCKGKDNCTAYTQKALALCQSEFGVVPALLPVIDKALVDKVYPHLQILKGFIKQLEAKAYSLAEVGQLAGYKLVNGRRSRSWTDEQAAEDMLSRLGIDPYEKKLLSPAKAEREAGKKSVKDLVSFSTGKPSIVVESDKREALSLGFTVVK